MGAVVKIGAGGFSNGAVGCLNRAGIFFFQMGGGLLSNGGGLSNEPWFVSKGQVFENTAAVFKQLWVGVGTCSRVVRVVGGCGSRHGGGRAMLMWQARWWRCTTISV